MTGVSFYNIPVTGKRLALLHELVPNAKVIAVLQDPNSWTFQTETREIEVAARAIGQKIIIVKASSEQEINAAFSTVAKSGAGALFVGGGAFFNARASQLVGLAALHAIPAIYVLSTRSLPADWSVMGGARRMLTAVLVFMWPEFSRARSRMIFRLSWRQSSSWLSTSRPPRRLVSQSLLR